MTGSDAPRRRILVVEDDEQVRRVVIRHLELSGHVPVEAPDAESVLLRPEETGTAFDVVITDIHLPGVSGLELATMLLSRQPLLPVILITGDADAQLAREALSHGPISYILKPFQMFELDAAVTQAVARLELVEATETLARSAAVGLPDKGAAGGALPSAWLRQVDKRSGAGLGHGYRVARIAGVIAAVLDPPLAPEQQRGLEVAARSHELGRLVSGAGSAAEVVGRSAQLLRNFGVSPSAVRGVKHMMERWDGSGGPDGVAAERIPPMSQVLAVADATDHRAAEGIAGGRSAEQAVIAAVAAVAAEAGSAFAPRVTAALQEARDAARTIWLMSRWGMEEKGG